MWSNLIYNGSRKNKAKKIDKWFKDNTEPHEEKKDE